MSHKHYLTLDNITATYGDSIAVSGLTIEVAKGNSCRCSGLPAAARQRRSG